MHLYIDCNNISEETYKEYIKSSKDLDFETYSWKKYTFPMVKSFNDEFKNYLVITTYELDYHKLTVKPVETSSII